MTLTYQCRHCGAIQVEEHPEQCGETYLKKDGTPKKTIPSIYERNDCRSVRLYRIPNSWHTCSPCGTKFFPKVDQSKFGQITLMQGDCPDCDAKSVTLIPIDDFLHYDTALWD